jgi:hypothetical protein
MQKMQEDFLWCAERNGLDDIMGMTSSFLGLYCHPLLGVWGRGGGGFFFSHINLQGVKHCHDDEMRERGMA